MLSNLIVKTLILSAVSVPLLVSPVLAGTKWDGKTTRVSISSAGDQGNRDSSYYKRPSISGDGRYVAFYSDANNLVPGDTNDCDDIFVHDRLTGETERVSVASDGTQGDSDSGGLAISGDGRFVAFASSAHNLVPDDTNSTVDVFVHDRLSGETKRVNVASDGTEGNMDSLNYDGLSISEDGRYITFESSANNLVPEEDTNIGRNDIFVHDQKTGTTELISVAVVGTTGSGRSEYASISADGRYVAFNSEANNLVPGDTGTYWDIFVRDRQTGTTERVSIASDGTPGNEDSYDPMISADGRYVVFWSYADNLIVGKTTDRRNIYLHDRQTNRTEQVSLSTGGAQPDNGSFAPSISAHGRYVVFESVADNLVPNDENQVDVFIRDRETSKTYRLSVAPDKWSSSNNWSHNPVISADGGYVAFVSKANNLIPGDSNGFTDVFVSSIEFKTTRIFKILPMSIILQQAKKNNGND